MVLSGTNINLMEQFGLMFKVVIAGAKNRYEVHPKDVISLKDLALMVKYDAVERISNAINNQGLQPYLFYKQSIKENDIQDENICNSHMLHVCRFNFTAGWFSEYKSAIDAIVFLKRDVVASKVLEQHDDILSTLEENITVESNLNKISIHIIKKSHLKKANEIKGIANHFDYVISIFLANIIYQTLSIFKKTFKIGNDVRKVEGYSTEFPKEEVFSPERYVKENMPKTEVELYHLFNFLTHKGLSQGKIMSLLKSDDEYVTDSTLRQRGSRLAKKAREYFAKTGCHTMSQH